MTPTPLQIWTKKNSCHKSLWSEMSYYFGIPVIVKGKKRCHRFTRVAQCEVKMVRYILHLSYFWSSFPNKANVELLPKHHFLWMKLFWKWCQTKTRKKYHQSIQREKKLRGKGSKVARGIFCVRLSLIHTQTTGGLSNQKFSYMLYLLLK